MKIALVYSFNPSAWVSCQKIVANLVLAYEELAHNTELIPIHYDANMTQQELWQNAESLFNKNPSHVVFLDHQPHPLPFLRYYLNLVGNKKERPVLIFHTYGDFTLYFDKWNELEKILAKNNVLFYAASIRQKNMLSELIPVNLIRVCPFPVDFKEFYFDQKIRTLKRKELKIADNEFVFLFTGRLSRQKRIHQLLKSFSEWRKETGANAKLILVGDSDGIGDPFANIFEMNGEYFHFINDLYKSLPSSDQVHIEFHGFIPNQEINSYYCAADCLVNISVHNDEDYGMSCAEALAAGLPLILSDWAGFASFALPELNNEVRFVNVSLGKSGKLISTASLKKQFSTMYQNIKSTSRNKTSAAIKKYASVDSVKQILQNGLESSEEFTNFNPLLGKLSYLYKNFSKNCFWDHKTSSFNSNYYRLYRHYVKSNPKHETKQQQLCPGTLGKQSTSK